MVICGSCGTIPWIGPMLSKLLLQAKFNPWLLIIRRSAIIQDLLHEACVARAAAQVDAGAQAATHSEILWYSSLHFASISAVLPNLTVLRHAASQAVCLKLCQ